MMDAVLPSSPYDNLALIAVTTWGEAFLGWLENGIAFLSKCLAPTSKIRGFG